MRIILSLPSCYGFFFNLRLTKKNVLKFPNRCCASLRGLHGERFIFARFPSVGPRGLFRFCCVVLRTFLHVELVKRVAWMFCIFTGFFISLFSVTRRDVLKYPPRMVDLSFPPYVFTYFCFLKLRY